MAVGCVNARSIGNKTAALCCEIADGHYDVFVITETWHECSGSTTLKRVTPPGYRCIDAARPIAPDAATDTIDFLNHGGLAIVYRDAVKLRRKSLDIGASTFEFLCGHASTNAGQFVLLAVYRPGSRAPSEQFFDELSAVFERLAAFGCPIVVCGDFNIHVDNTDDIYAVRLSELLQSFGCVQHVAEPTHSAGHTLDLVITRSDTSISALRVGDMISDHALVRFNLHVAREHSDTEWITRRAWRRLSSDAFAFDLAASALCGDLTALEDKSADDLAELYGSELTRLLDQHCPVVKVRHKAKQSTPWFDADCRAVRRRARAAERRFRRTRAEADRAAWNNALKLMHSQYEKKCSNYWRDEIAASKGNTTRLWRTFRGVLGEAPCDETGPHSAEDFASFFRDKVDGVRASTSSTPIHDVPLRATPTLAEWTPVSPDETEKLISAAVNKTCDLDPAPTWLVKEMRGLLSPFITLLFNKSLITGCFPAAFKQALVRPLLKRPGLDAGDRKSFRPVSNLPLLSKLLERVVQARLQAFLDINRLMPTAQSAYRKYHSTETATAKVFNDLLLATDRGQVSALCLLDLTAAFDTVDHQLLLRRLECQFGLRGISLEWFQSYLSGRSYRVIYAGSTSSVIYIVCSVPQGSVLYVRHSLLTYVHFIFSAAP